MESNTTEELYVLSSVYAQLTNKPALEYNLTSLTLLAQIQERISQLIPKTVNEETN